MKKKTILFFICVVFGASNFYGCVSSSKDINKLRSHIDNLEKARHQTDKNIRVLDENLIALKKEIELLKKSKGNNFDYATIVADIDALKEDVKLFNGRIEESNYLIDQRTKILGLANKQTTNEISRLDKTVTLNSNRLIQIANYTGMEHNFNIAIPQENGTNIEGAEVLQNAVLSPKELYEIAISLLEQGSPDNAKIKFQEFLSTYPKSDLADNCQFWIGEVFYRSEFYKKAILEFQKVIDNYSTGNKVPSALLRQAFSFEKLNELTNAKLVLKELIIKYPNTPEAKIGERKLKIIASEENSSQ